MLHAFKNMRPKLGERVFIAPTAEVIGDVEIGEDSSLWFHVVVRGDVNQVRIGARTNIQDGTVIHVTHEKFPTILGNDVTVGHNVTLHGCRIGNRCLIGMGAIVLDGAEIADDVIIAAGALVTPGTLVRSGTLFAGTPAKYKRDLRSEEIAGLKQSALNYVQYVNDYRG